MDYTVMKYQILNLIGQNCMTMDAGQQVYDRIHPLLLDRITVELDFAGVRRIASPFLNFAIGQLLSDIHDVDRVLKITNMEPFAKEALDYVLENAKQYYSNSQYREAVDNSMQEMLACA